jgi:hypothetical protein
VYWDLQVDETHNYVTADGAIHHNSGKSVLCCVEVFRRCAEIPHCTDGFRRSRWVIVRNTRDQLKKTTLKTWLAWFPDGIAGRWKESEMTFYLEVGDIRAEIMFLPLDTPDDQRRLLSLELTGVFINEAREVHPELIIASRSRMPRYPPKKMLPQALIDATPPGESPYWYGMIMDTNPPSEDSWLYEQFEEVKPEGWEIYKQPSGLAQDAENKDNLGPTYYEDMMSGATEDFIRVHVHGRYGRSLIGRPVFEKSYDSEFHVADEELKAINSHEYPVLIGLDFGRTPAAVIGQRDWRARVNVLESIYVENIGLESFLTKHLKPLLTQKFPHNRFIIIGDPAGWAKSQLNEENAFDILKKCGFHTAVRAPTNDIEPRIAAVEHLLAQHVEGKPMLVFSPAATSPGMKHLLMSLNGGYKYKRKQDGSYESSPAKDKFSHCADALQYLCLGANMAGGSGLEPPKRREVKPYAASGWT